MQGKIMTGARSKVPNTKCTNANFRIPVKMHVNVKKLAKKLKVSASSLYLRWSIAGLEQEAEINKHAISIKKGLKKREAERLDNDIVA